MNLPLPVCLFLETVTGEGFRYIFRPAMPQSDAERAEDLRLWRTLGSKGQ